jgi:biopolymer transport protein ExbD
VTGEELTAKLLSLKKDKPVDVILAGDKDASLQTLLKAMDGVRAAGITSVGIAARAERPAGTKKK